LTLTVEHRVEFAVERLNGKKQLSINAILLLNSPKFMQRNLAFMRSTKHAKEVIAIFLRFCKDLLQSEGLVHGAIYQY